MTAEIPAEAEQAVSAMDEATFTACVARVRAPEESADPMERAAQALRQMRGLDRPGKSTKEQAATAMRQYASGSRNS